MDSITIILIVLYFLCYFIFFFVKTVRDYIMEYQRGYTVRWENSIWKGLFPVWFESYLLSNESMFKDTAPNWAIKLFWNDKENNFKVGVDGAHQLDGLIFLLPHSIMILLLARLIHLQWYWIVLCLVALPFLFWYSYFNLNYHIWQQKTGKQWFRIHWWVKIFFGKK